MEKNMLEVSCLRKKYKDKYAIDGISFSVGKGEIVALLGVNGAGKTTILNSIAGIIHDTEGDIYYNNENLNQKPSLRKEFGILINATFFDYLSVEENLRLLMNASGVKDKNICQCVIRDVLLMVGLEKEKKNKVKSFSFGMKQRLGLAQALLSNINFLMLDEPFVGLDPIGKEIFKDAIVNMAHEKNVGVLFSSHDLSDVEDICDRVVMIKEGKMIFNDKFDKSKRITFITSKPIKYTKAFTEIDATIEENRVSINDSNTLSNVIREILKQCDVVDVIVVENKLMKLFSD